MRALLAITAALLLAVSLSYWKASLRWADAAEARKREESPSGRVLAYHQNLKRDEPTVLRFYSALALIARTDESEPASLSILSFEETVGLYDHVKVLEERLAEGAKESLVIAQADSAVLRYELVREDGEWYIARVSWGDGTVVKGFDAPVKTFKAHPFGGN